MNYLRRALRNAEKLENDLTIARDLARDVVADIQRGIADEYGGAQTWGPYADLDAAEASGDAWGDGDTITLTSGPDFKYYDSASSGGHSGLIHLDAFNESGEVSSVTVYAASDAGADPDNFGALFTSASTGTKTAQWDFATDSGYSAVQKLATGGRAFLTITSVGAADSSDAASYYIVDNAHVANKTQTVSTFATIGSSYFIDGSTATNFQVIANASIAGGTKWGVMTDWFVTWADSGKTFATPRRIWHYCKNGKQTVWFDGEATPAFSSTNTPSNAGSSGNRAFSLLAGDAGAANRTDLRFSYAQRGAITVS